MKPNFLARVLASLIVVVAIESAAQPVQAAGCKTKEWKTGLTLAPWLNLDQLSTKERKRIGCGSYLINAVASCSTCHSCPTYTGLDVIPEPNAATHLAGRLDNIWGLIPNLTPDEEGRPLAMMQKNTPREDSGVSEAEFVNEIMRRGRSARTRDTFDGDLSTVMPWASHQQMTTRDLKAIYSYLAELPSTERPPAEDCLFFGDRERL